MIEYSWFGKLSADHHDEVAPLVAEAATEDAEGGFPVIAPEEVAEKAQHLLVWLLPGGRPDFSAPTSRSLAAYLSLRARDDGSHEVRYVVRPRYRSQGITTLLVERMGLDVRRPGGWADTGATQLFAWATGDHPAAQRLAGRFGRLGLCATRRDWHLLAPLRERHGASRPESGVQQVDRGSRELAEWLAAARPGWDPPAAAVVLATRAGSGIGGAVWVQSDATEETEYGVAGRIWAVVTTTGQEEHVLPLLEAATRSLLDSGLRVAAITVHAANEDLVRACRHAGFSHYRTDTEYSVV